MNLRRPIFAVLLVFAFGPRVLAEPAASTPSGKPTHSFIFKAYDGEPYMSSSRLDKISFWIDRPDQRNPPQFLLLGQFIPGTKFKLVKFDYKTRLDPKLNEQTDCSQLTIQNVETKEKIVLTLDER